MKFGEGSTEGREGCGGVKIGLKGEMVGKIATGKGKGGRKVNEESELEQGRREMGSKHLIS